LGVDRARLRVTCALCVLMAASACAARHQARGLVLKVDPDRAAVTVSHEPIPGFMDAMVMPFIVKDTEDLTDVRPGDRIAFRITVRKGTTEVDRVRLVSAASVDSGMTLSPPSPTLARIGTDVPAFSLTNQHGTTISLESLRGTVVAVTFIYSRCPLPDYCPRMMTNFDAVRKRFADRMGKDLTLLTVTFDPKYDTPETLKLYAEQFKANVPGWHFLTGSAENIARVCSLFGVEYFPDEGLITHTLQTAVIDRDGRLAATVEGKDYSGQQLGDLIEQLLPR
jgi:protein SCO1/2